MDISLTLVRVSIEEKTPVKADTSTLSPGSTRMWLFLDVASMHPTTIEILNLFGKYTEKFTDLKEARMAIKRRDFMSARKMFDGRLTPYLENEDGADKLAYALKIVINIVYGLTSANFLIHSVTIETKITLLPSVALSI